MLERTSGESYNPTTFKVLGDYSRWIDESTNTFDITFEKGKNVFMFTGFHPKFLFPDNATGTVVGTVGGKAVNYTGPLDDANLSDPHKLHLVQLQNTYGEMDYQIGYGRKFYIFKGINNRRVLTWTPHVNVGATMGAPRGIWQNPDGSYTDKQGPIAIIGPNASIGHMVQYSFGKVYLFADQKWTTAQLHQSFLGGTADMKLNYMYVTFGLGLQLWNRSHEARP